MLLCHIVVVAVEDRGGSRGVTFMRKVNVVSVLATFVSAGQATRGRKKNTVCWRMRGAHSNRETTVCPRALPDRSLGIGHDNLVFKVRDSYPQGNGNHVKSLVLSISCE